MASNLTRRGALAASAALLLARGAQAQEGRDIGRADIPAEGGEVSVLFVRPPGAGPFPIVLVAEDGTGLGRLVTDSCAGLAAQGFLAVAPALFAHDPPDIEVMRRLDVAAHWAASQGGDEARLGITGFGVGGRATWLYDAHSPAVKAAVAWYGPMQGTTTAAQPQTALDVASKLNGPLLGLYGKSGPASQAVLLDAESRAKAAGKVAEIVVYVDSGEDFAAAGRSAFREAATIDGWKRALGWFRAHGVG